MNRNSDRPGPQGEVRRLRVGVVNLMPRAETYESLVTAALGPAVEVAWIRLATHAYTSTDATRLATAYASYAQVLAAGPLDGLVLTGAPVETIAYDTVRYWDELTALLAHARTHARSTLGICWGAMALAKTLGIEKVTLAQKVFGSFAHELSPAGRRLLPGLDGVYRCAQSRHATLREDDLAEAVRAGRVEGLAAAPGTGTTLLATPDRRVVMHLGHPEYEPARIAYEWARDRAAGRTDVPAPQGFDDRGEVPTVRWEPDSRAFFRAWREILAGAPLPAEDP